MAGSLFRKSGGGRATGPATYLALSLLVAIVFLQPALSQEPQPPGSESLEKSASQADVIALGEIRSVQSGALAERRAWRFAPQEALKGDVAASEIVVVLDARRQGSGEALSDFPLLQVGQRYVLFLRRLPRTGEYGIVGDAVLNSHIDHRDRTPEGEALRSLEGRILEALGRDPAELEVGASGRLDFVMEKASESAPPVLLRSTPVLDLDHKPVVSVGSENGSIRPLTAEATQVILAEGFEGTFPSGPWSVNDDNGSTGGQVYWDDTNARSYAGSWSAWCADGGTDSSPAGGNYKNNMNTWMVYGPFSLSDATGGSLSFRYWLRSEINYDHFKYYVSRDGNQFYGYQLSGNSNGWSSRSIDFTNVPTIGNVTGDSSVWIAFVFSSDGSNTDLGAFVDEVRVEKVVPSPADLDLQLVDIPSGTYAPGAAIQVDNRIVNVGGLTSPAYRITFYASVNTTISASDYFIGYVDRGGIAPSGTHNYTTSGNLPADLPAGSYYIGAILTVSDASSANNVNFDATPITVCAVPGQPSTPSPASGASLSAQPTLLDWATSSGASSYDLYLNGSYHTTTTVSQWTPNLSFGPGTHTWKVIAINSCGQTSGAVWSFTYTPCSSPGTPSGPNPASGSSVTSSPTLLNWADTSGAASYDIYVDGSFAANVSVSQWTANRTFAPGSHNWQIVARASCGQTTTGPLWTFTVTGGPDIAISPLTLNFTQGTPRAIYVEIDWMETPTHSHRPSQAVIDRIVQTFAAAGYAITIDVSNAIPHQNILQVVNLPTGSPEVDAIVAEHFDHANDNRYYYSIWGHQYQRGSVTNSSGIADPSGRVHLVTLGTFSGQTGTFNNQVGTFIHEFGHNMGQWHGGADHDNFKPNYLSIMNYYYQLDGIAAGLVARNFANTPSGFDIFSYSHGLLPNLDENNLNENLGIGLGRGVDWNCNGPLTDNVAKDIGGVANPANPFDFCVLNGTRSVLSDFDNWTSIATQIRTVASSPESSVPQEPSPACITSEEYRPLAERVGQLRAAGLLPPDGPEPGRPEVNQLITAEGEAGRFFTISNTGGLALSVTSMTLDTATSWIRWEPKAPFTVPAGGSQRVHVYVDFAQAPAGQTTRRMLVSSNDPDESPYPGGVNLIIAGLGPCYTLTTTHTGSGGHPTPSPASSSGCPTGQFRGGAQIQLTASPASGWTVASWTGTSNNSSTSTSNSLTMPAASHTASVNYLAPCSFLSLTHTGTGTDPAPTPASSPGCSTGYYRTGTAIALTAAPASGWVVQSWTGTTNNASSANVNGVVMPAGPHAASVRYVAIPSGTAFYTVPPCRVIDTRPSAPLSSGLARTFPTFSLCGIPSTAKAVAVNATVVGSDGPGYLTLYPGGTASPETSTVNFSTGLTRANNAVLGLAADGTLEARAQIFEGGTQVHLIVDVAGYFE